MCFLMNHATETADMPAPDEQTSGTLEASDRRSAPLVTNERARSPRGLAVTDRTRVRRLPKRGSHDTSVVNAILDEALVCHVGFTMPHGDSSTRSDAITRGDGTTSGDATSRGDATTRSDARRSTAPFVIPTIHVRIDDLLYIHGSAASYMLRSLARELEVCVTVTLIDGLVFARSAFHHSMNYRSAMVFGTATLVEDEREKRRALDALVDKLSPARTKACRPPNDKELLATKVIAVPIVEASAKIRTGPPIDDAEDMSSPYWAGVLPMQLARGIPRTAADCDVGPPIDLR